MLFCTSFFYGQVNAYTFTQSAGTYTEITGGTVLGTATTSLSFDSQLWAIADGSIPFSFNFNGINYTGCSVNSNGYITFGSTLSSSFTSTAISSPTAYSGAIAAWSGDLCSVFVSGLITGETRWEVVGTAPNREFVIQFKNWRPAYSSSTTNIPFMNFQIRLTETINVVKIVYGPSGFAAGSTASTGTRQIGLRGATNADFNNRINTTSVAFNSSVAGTTNTASQAYNTSVPTPGIPADGFTYTWTPPAVCTATPTAGNATSSATLLCSGYSTNLNLTGSTSGVSSLAYQWQSSPAGANTFTNISGATTIAYTATVTANTDYQCLVTCIPSGLSSTSTIVNVAIAPRSYATIPLSESFEATWLTSCVVAPLGQDAPTVNWTSTAGTDPDASWRADNTTTTLSGWSSTSGAYSPLAQSGSRSARFHSFNTFPAGTQGFLDLNVNLSPTGNKQLSFWYIAPSTGADTLEVLLSEDGGSTFTLLTTSPAIPTTAVTIWTNVTVNLSSVSATAVIRFRGTGDNGSFDIGLDNVVISQPCSGTPTAGTIASNPTTVCYGGVANINSTGSSAGQGVTYQWQSASASLGPYTNISGANSASYTTTSIVTETWFKLVITCTNSSLNSESNIISITPTTPITTIPYTENFNTTTAGSLPSCWQANITSGTENWSIGTTTNAGEITSNFDGNFAYKLYSNSDALFVSPAFNFNAIGSGNIELDFQMHRRSPAHVSDILTFYVNTQPNLTGATLLQNYPSLITGTSPATSHAAAVTTVPANGWYNYKMTIPSSFNAAPSVYLIARGVTAGSFSSYALGFDDFRLQDALLSNNNFEISGFKAYPNPTNSILNVEFSSDITNVTINNMLGQEVLSKRLNATSAQIDMSNLQSGIYLVKVEAGNDSKTIKVFKK